MMNWFTIKGWIIVSLLSKKELYKVVELLFVNQVWNSLYIVFINKNLTFSFLMQFNCYILFITFVYASLRISARNFFCKSFWWSYFHFFCATIWNNCIHYNAIPELINQLKQLKFPNKNYSSLLLLLFFAIQNFTIVGFHSAMTLFLQMTSFFSPLK